MSINNSLVGQFLIASPSLKDPNFEKTVTLVCEQNESGSLGLIINKPLHQDLEEVISQMNLNEIDNIYSYLARRIPNKFTIMHCCGIYPAPNKKLNLNFIPKMIKRYPSCSIGYSGHENPNDHAISSMAIALGAIALERHIAKENEENGIKINAYSVNSSEISSWLKSLKNTIDALGEPKTDSYICEEEYLSLKSLQRGVFTSKNIKKGEFSRINFRNYSILNNNIKRFFLDNFVYGKF